MKTIATLALLLLTASSLLADPTPAPLLTPSEAPTPPPLSEQQKLEITSRAIDATIRQMAAGIVRGVTALRALVYDNPHGLTAEEVQAGLGPEKAASLIAADGAITQFMNTFAPGQLAPAPTPVP